MTRVVTTIEFDSLTALLFVGGALGDAPVAPSIPEGHSCMRAIQQPRIASLVGPAKISGRHVPEGADQGLISLLRGP